MSITIVSQFKSNPRTELRNFMIPNLIGCLILLLIWNSIWARLARRGSNSRALGRKHARNRCSWFCGKNPLNGQCEFTHHHDWKVKQLAAGAAQLKTQSECTIRAWFPLCFIARIPKNFWPPTGGQSKVPRILEKSNLSSQGAKTPPHPTPPPSQTFIQKIPVSGTL